MQPMEIVKQTGTTIIFEKFNSDPERNLVALLNKEISIDKFARELIGKDSKLTVKNFADFLKKFSPTIYLAASKKNDSISIDCTLEKPNCEHVVEINLKDHAFFRLITEVIDQKANSGKDNFEFPYDKLKVALTPEGEKGRINRIYTNLYNCIKEHNRLTDYGQKSSLEALPLIESIAKERSEIVKLARNFVLILPVILKEVNEQIEAIEKEIGKTPQGGSAETPRIAGTIKANSKGKLEFVPQDGQKTKALPLENDITPADGTNKDATVLTLSQENGCALANETNEDATVLTLSQENGCTLANETNKDATVPTLPQKNATTPANETNEDATVPTLSRKNDITPAGETNKDATVPTLPQKNDIAPAGETKKLTVDEQIAELIRKDLKKYAADFLRNSEKAIEIVVRAIVRSLRVDYEKEGMSKTQYLAYLKEFKLYHQELYKACLESFAKSVTPIVEKFAGVKSFFDHATFDGELPQDVSVIIANCKVNDIIPSNEERFKEVFGALSAEKGVNRIWFGIIPAIPYDEAISNGNKGRSKRSLTTEDSLSYEVELLPDELEDVVESNSPAKKKDPSDLVTLEDVETMLKHLTEAKIMTFINYKADENTGFMELSASGIDRYRRDFGSMNSEYAVFVYPNFTILPKEKGLVKIGTKYNDKGEEVDVEVTIPGVYLDASYVACGMMVGVQNYKLLENKGYYINQDYPCVRFDLEENSRRITTKLNRETQTEMLKTIQEAIARNRFGFVFGDNVKEHDGNILKNSYVLNARSLEREADGEYKPLYKTLVKNVVSQILGTITLVTDYAYQADIDTFYEKYVKIWLQNNKFSKTQYDNNILDKDDSIDVRPGKNRQKELAILFGKKTELSGIRVVDDEAPEARQS